MAKKKDKKKDKIKFTVCQGFKYGNHGAINFFINYAPSIHSVGMWDIPKGCSYGDGLYFDVKHLDKVIHILKKIKKIIEQENKSKLKKEGGK